MRGFVTAKRLLRSVLLLLLCVCCLTVTTFALVYSEASLGGNSFNTGTVDINLNDGKPVISDGELLFSPGAEERRDFFIENTGSAEVYYKIYFSDISGALADVLEVRICAGDKLLYSGVPSALTKSKLSAANDTLKAGERRDLQIYFRLSENAGNSANAANLTFKISADATQVKNNANKEFD